VPNDATLPLREVRFVLFTVFLWHFASHLSRHKSKQVGLLR
jgi:hypothetical protein